MTHNVTWLSRNQTSIMLHNNDDKQLLHSIEDINSFKIPPIFLKDGLLLLKISHKSHKRVKLKVEPSEFKFIYESPKGKTYDFLVDDIKGLYFGDSALRFREEFQVSKEFEKQWISISFFNQSKNRLKTLHLIADTVYDFRRVRAIFSSFKRLKDDISQTFFLNLSDLHDSTRSMVVKKAESGNYTNRDSLSLEDVVKFTKRMNVNLSATLINQIFIEARGGKLSFPRELLFDQFKRFVSLLNKRVDLDQYWEEFSDKRSKMQFNLFRDFMLHEQTQTDDAATLQKWFSKYDSGMKGFWTKSDFNSFLLSKFCSPIGDFVSSEGYFSHPLNEYYVLSSHNTYLMGRQIIGESSVEGYIKALQRGCRCLEIDIWNSNNGDPEPLVNHGRTFTSGISLRNVAKTIKTYAFQVTSFPLILSIENHCTPESQREAISIFKSTFGEQLVSEPLDEKKRLPSPDMLKFRILLKVKKTDFSLFPSENVSQSASSAITTSTTTTLLSESNETPNYKFPSKLRKKNSTKSVIQSLSDLGVYIQGVRFRNFSLPESKTFNHCFSLSEKSINAMLKDENKRISVDKHNRSYLMRIYPSKFRLKSTNFNPIIFWRFGAQMVATNWQTYDLGQQINEAMFNAPFGDGYVLKPAYLRSSLSKGTSLTKSRCPTYQKTLEVTVISAHQLPKPSGWSGETNPFILLDLIGAETVAWSPIKPATRIVAGNGHNPIWNQTFYCSFDADSDLVFIKFTVSSCASGDGNAECKILASVIHNVFAIRGGLRYLTLKDLCGEHLLYSSIFVRFKLRDNM